MIDIIEKHVVLLTEDIIERYRVTNVEDNEAYHAILGYTTYHSPELWADGTPCIRTALFRMKRIQYKSPNAEKVEYAT